MAEGQRSFYFGGGTRRHAIRSETEDYATAWCGLGGRKGYHPWEHKALMVKVEPNCKSCAKALSREVAA